MKAYFGRRYRLSASHRLHCDALTDADNREIYGKCNNPHGHGHNYVIEVLVGGEVDPVTGMVCDLVQLDECVTTRNSGSLRPHEPEFLRRLSQDCADDGEFQH